jgi:superfamily II DNA or RNA helicase
MNEAKISKSQALQDAVLEILENDTVLREKQREAFAKMSEKELIEISDGYFRLPTAFGKTVMFSLLARAFLNKSTKKSKVIILVPRITLVWQTLDKLQQFADKTGSVYIGTEKDTSADIIVSTYHSADRLINELQAKKQEIGLIIADEAHHALGEQKAKTIQSIAENTPVVGFTATPTFSEEHALGDLLSTELYTLSIEDCVKAGSLCPVKNVLYRPSINYDILEAPLKQGQGSDYDYNKIGRQIKLQTLIDEISQVYCTYGDNDRKFSQMRAIINCPTIEIADKQAEKLNELYGRDIAVSVHSNQKDFKKRVDAFLAKKFRVVCQVNTLTEGLDDPSVELCINYPSHSPVKIEQSGGRVLRQYGKNKFAYVLDTIFRATPEESLEASLRRAFVAGQVLYRDVAGEFVVKPEEQIKQPVKPVKDSQPNSKEPFDVVTDETLLNRLNPHYKEWRRDNEWLAAGYVPLVDELHDISPKYLAKKLFDPKTVKRIKPAEVLAKMKWLKETSMPDAIQIKRTANNRRCLYLRDEYYAEFVKNSGYQEVSIKNKRDIDANKLASDYMISKQQAKLKIMQMAQQINARYKIDEKTGHLVLCFDRKHLGKVTANLNPRVTETKETNDTYLDARVLAGKYVDATIAEVYDALRDLYRPFSYLHLRAGDKFRDAIIVDGQIKLYSNSRYAKPNYKLQKDFVDEFCKTIGVLTKEQKRQQALSNDRDYSHLKHKEKQLWKSEKTLWKYLDAEPNDSHISLHDKLEEFAKQYPGAVKLASDYKSFLFNLSYLSKFCAFSGIVPSPVPLKTDEWKNAEELKSEYHIQATVEEIAAALKKFSGYKSWTSNTIVVLMNPETDLLDLCLNVNGIKEFLEFSGLPQKPKVDVIKDGTKLIETLAEIKKNKKKRTGPDNGRGSL